MAIQNIAIKKGILERNNGVVVFDLEKYQTIERELNEYREKMKVLRSLEDFDSLATWGRNFAKNKKITKKQILEND